MQQQMDYYSANYAADLAHQQKPAAAAVHVPMPMRAASFSVPSATALLECQVEQLVSNPNKADDGNSIATIFDDDTNDDIFDCITTTFDDDDIDIFDPSTIFEAADLVNITSGTIETTTILAVVADTSTAADAVAAAATALAADVNTCDDSIDMLDDIFASSSDPDIAKLAEEWASGDPSGDEPMMMDDDMEIDWILGVSGGDDDDAAEWPPAVVNEWLNIAVQQQPQQPQQPQRPQLIIKDAKHANSVGGSPRDDCEPQHQVGDVVTNNAGATAAAAAAAMSSESNVADKLWEIYVGSEFPMADDLLVTTEPQVVTQLVVPPSGEMHLPPPPPPLYHQPGYPTPAAPQPPTLVSLPGRVPEPAAVPAMPLMQQELLPPPAQMSPTALLPSLLLPPAGLLPSALPPAVLSALLSALPSGLLSGLPSVLAEVQAPLSILTSSLPTVPLFGMAPVAAMPTSYTAGFPIMNLDGRAQKMLTKLRLLNHPRMRDLIRTVAACKKLGARSPGARMKIDSACEKVLRDVAVVRTLALQSGMLAIFERDPGLDAFMDKFIAVCESYQKDAAAVIRDAATLLNEFETKLSLALQRDVGPDPDEGEPGKSKGGRRGVKRRGDAAAGNEGGGLLGNVEPIHMRTILKRKYSAEVQKLQEEFAKRKKVSKLPETAINILKQWWTTNLAWPYPTDDIKKQLCTATGLNHTQISNWFINQRKRHWVKLFNGKQPSCRAEAEKILRHLKVIPSS
ncbi:hypothetical protein Vretimale_12287 [Volvox reticuliferus]|uniref:Homeobox domain-containing protein n=1 Tax=Volvox reticuliferus TaxID=1737510 RepID=A0A8J4GJR9_9CHLO|nr:hypothetical protein Vretimale_12287 [Volvox reticuliferus]